MKNENYESYTYSAIQFLQDYSWIYNFKVTNLLSDNIIDTIPHQWKLFLNSLNIKTFNEVFIEQQNENSKIPEIILKFLNEYNSLKISFQTYKSHGPDSFISISDKRGIGDKKVHEVSNFSNFLSSQITGEHIIDVGSGLGYLGEQLTRKGFSVTGLECSKNHISRAESRKKKTSAHTFETLQINIDSDIQASVDHIIGTLKLKKSISLVSL